MMRMRLSCFGYIKDLDDIARAGYDLAELHVKEIVGFDEAEYKKARARLRSCGIGAEVFDNPIPLDSRVADPTFDLGHYRGFLEKASDRCAEMGARYFVFGNGKARSLPGEGNFALGAAVGVDEAAAKFDEFFSMLLDIAAARNITVLIEPLGRNLSNIVNSIPEAVAFIKKHGRPNLKTFLDYRWMVAEGRPLSDLVGFEPYIRHVHLDNPNSEFPRRIVPRLDDGFDYKPFFETLKRICYKEILSVEASVFEDFAAEIRSCLDFFAAHGIKPYRAE
jgi:D-psicose/D-tagatose/L-ribulose 3-epimerase